MSDKSDLEKIFGDQSSGQVIPEEEVCNGIDNDCDGVVDDDLDFDAAEEFYRMSTQLPIRQSGMDDDCDGVIDEIPDSEDCHRVTEEDFFRIPEPNYTNLYDLLSRMTDDTPHNIYVFRFDDEPIDCTGHRGEILENFSDSNAAKEALRDLDGFLPSIESNPIHDGEKACRNIRELMIRGLDDPVLISTEQALLFPDVGCSIVGGSMEEPDVINTMRCVIDYLYPSRNDPRSMSEALQNHYNKNMDNLTADQRRLITEVNLGIHDSIDPLDSPFELSFLDNSLMAIAQQASVDIDNRTRLEKWYDAAYAFAPEVTCKKLTFSDFVAYVNENPEWS